MPLKPQSLPMEKNWKSLKFWDANPLIFRVFSTISFFFEFVLNNKVVDIQVFFPWPQDLGQSNICAKSYGKHTEIAYDVSI